MGRIPSEEDFRDIFRHPEAETVPSLLIFSFDMSIFFINAGYFV